MAIDKKFIHFKTYDNFISHNGIGSEANITTPTEGSEDTGDAIYGQIKGSSVVFIKDVQKMWTHGQLYDCGGSGNMSEQDPVFMASPAATITEAKKTEWDSKQNAISDLDTIRTNAANYKGTVTSVKVNGVSKSPSSGVVDLGYINKQLSTSTSSSMTLSPNIYYRNTSTSLSTLTITLGSVSNSNIINEYFIEFTTRSSGTTVSLPSTVKWANGETPTFENGKTYQISIVNNLGVCTKFG